MVLVEPPRKGNMFVPNQSKVQNSSNNHHRGRGSNVHIPKGGRSRNYNYYTPNNVDYPQTNRDYVVPSPLPLSNRFDPLYDRGDLYNPPSPYPYMSSHNTSSGQKMRSGNFKQRFLRLTVIGNACR